MKTEAAKASGIHANLLKWVAKPKRCKNPECRTLFIPDRPMAVVCHWKCWLRFEELRRESKVRKEIREQRLRLKPRSDWIREAQTACNAYIRLRDSAKPCAACETVKAGAWDASHYRSTAAAPHLRFNECNIHRCCTVCNQHRSGNLIEMRRVLVKRLGIEVVEALENDNSAAKWSIEDLKQIKATYKQKLKELKQSHETM